MKQNTHPIYKEVVYQDTATGFMFLTRSTLQPKETIEFEGKTYPVIKVEISSDSHPFFTGSERLVTAEGRIDKFLKRFSKGKKKKK